MAAEETDIVVFRTRLRPTNAQVALLYRNCAGSRFIYNYVLHMQKERHEVFRAAREKFLEDNPGKKPKDFKPNDSEKPFSAYDLKKQIAIINKEEETSWLAELDQDILQDSVINFGKTWRRFVEKIGGYPRFRNRDKHNSFSGNNSPRRQRILGKRFKFRKIDTIKMFEEPKPKVSDEVQYLIDNGQIDLSRPTSYTVSRKANKWWISIRWQVPKTIIPVRDGKSVGIDMGVAEWATTSDGEHLGKDKQVEKKLKQLLERRDFYQRQLARRPKQKGKDGKNFHGSNRVKTKKKLAKVSNKIAEIRRNYSHHSSKDLTTSYAKIALEKLNIQNMTKSAKGTTEKPGKNVKQKAGLNRSILQQNWYQLRSMLEYKMARSGGSIKNVDPKYTSQMCSSCQHVNEKNRLSQSKFKCVKCGHEENADLNAAKNIHRIAFGG